MNSPIYTLVAYLSDLLYAIVPWFWLTYPFGSIDSIVLLAYFESRQCKYFLLAR